MAWLPGWSYRKEITITGQSGAGTDYQVDFDIGDSAGGDFHLEGNCTNFPQDIAVTDNDGTTPLDYWIEDITADPLKMLIEVADDLGSNQTIYIYYGKSGATTDSNGANTFLQYHGAASSSFLDSLIITVPFIYEGRIKPTAATHLILWGVADGYYKATDGIQLQSYTSGGTRAIRSFEATSESLETEVPNLSSGITYDTKITATVSNVHGYVDDNEVSDGFGTNIPDTAIGLIFDLVIGTGEQEWSFVRKHNDPEPAFSSAGSEETPPTGWTGIIDGITNPASIIGIAVADIAKVNGI